MWIILGVCAAVFVLVIAFAGARGAFDGGMSDEEADVPPAQRLTDDAGADDIAALRFTPTLWGYRPAEVDDALSRLQARIAVQDARLAALGQPVAGQQPAQLLTAQDQPAQQPAAQDQPAQPRSAQHQSAQHQPAPGTAPTDRGTDPSTERFRPPGSGTATFSHDQ